MKFNVIKSMTTTTRHEIEADSVEQAEAGVLRGRGKRVNTLGETIIYCFVEDLFMCQSCKVKYPENFTSSKSGGICQYCSGEAF